MVCLFSEDENGQVYVETKSLDGETNLKGKKVPQEICRDFGCNVP
jgi:magnesium-transporting ATPase (P-type)